MPLFPTKKSRSCTSSRPKDVRQRRLVGGVGHDDGLATSAADSPRYHRDSRRRRAAAARRDDNDDDDAARGDDGGDDDDAGGGDDNAALVGGEGAPAPRGGLGEAALGVSALCRLCVSATLVRLDLEDNNLGRNHVTFGRLCRGLVDAPPASGGGGGGGGGGTACLRWLNLANNAIDARGAHEVSLLQQCSLLFDSCLKRLGL